MARWRSAAMLNLAVLMISVPGCSSWGGGRLLLRHFAARRVVTTTTAAAAAASAAAAAAAARARAKARAKARGEAMMTMTMMSTTPPEGGKSRLEVLYRDPGLLVVSKPFAVRMDGPWEETVEKMAKEHFPGKVRFIHQLDFATSGVLMLGLDKATTRDTHAHFDARTVAKEYLSILEGWMDREVTVDEPICRWDGPVELPPRGEDGTHGKSKDFRMMIGGGTEENRGKEAVTHMYPLRTGLYRGKKVTLARLKPVSGRRHQLRLHTRHIGHGIVGDFTYADDREWAQGCDRMMLHAWRVSIPYEPRRGEEKEGGGGGGEGQGGIEGETWGRMDGEDEGRVWFQARDALSRFVVES